MPSGIIGRHSVLFGGKLHHRCFYRVIYGDTDQMGVVYYANYLAFFERGRCEYMRAQGFRYDELERQGFFLPVVDAACRFRAGAKFDDLLAIDTAVSSVSRCSLEFSYRIFRIDDRTGEVGRLLADGTTKHATTNSDQRVVRHPEYLLALIRAISPGLHNSTQETQSHTRRSET